MATLTSVCNTSAAASRLIKLIREYESDTFSADGSNLTLDLADQVAAKLIDQIEDHLDGVRLSALLDEVRGE